MAGLSSPGLGSGLDINSLVSQLVAAEKAPPQAQITRAQTVHGHHHFRAGHAQGRARRIQFRADAAQVDSKPFRRAPRRRRIPAFSRPRRPTTASPGSYDIEVEQLASAHQLTSQAFAAAPSQVVGTGTLTITSGAKTFRSRIDAAHNTLAQIRDAINQATGNDRPVRATIVNASRRRAPGADRHSERRGQCDHGGPGGRRWRSRRPRIQPDAHHQLHAAARGRATPMVSIAGFEHHSATNTHRRRDRRRQPDAARRRSPVKSTRSPSPTTPTRPPRASRISSTSTTRSPSRSARSAATSPTTKKAGPLLGDSMLRGIESRAARQARRSRDRHHRRYQTLASIGITTAEGRHADARQRQAQRGDGSQLRRRGRSCSARTTAWRRACRTRFDAAARIERRDRRALQAAQPEERRSAERAGRARGAHGQGRGALSGSSSPRSTACCRSCRTLPRSSRSSSTRSPRSVQQVNLTLSSPPRAGR